jgi:hypothetical protein
MAIYGNHSAPFGTRARLDVMLPEELGYEPLGAKVITDTSRLFALKTHFYTYNATLMDVLGIDPTVFQIELIYVFFKDTKQIVQFWTIQYLRSEYGAVDIVFRRLTDWSVDNKFQEYESENFACFFPSSVNVTREIFTGVDGAWVNVPGGAHALWTGCDYWPQNYSLGLAWTNATIEHWDPDDAMHHVGYIAYYPNCSNWDTDNWNWYLTNMWTQWKKDQPLNYPWLNPNRISYNFDETTTGPGPLTTRYDAQPETYEVQAFDPNHVAASPLMMGQWNFTLTAATAKRMAKFVNVMGVTNCSDTFGYVNNWLHPTIGHYAGDWDSDPNLDGGRTLSEIKYGLARCFNATYKLSSLWDDAWGDDPLDLSSWYPFSGVTWEYLEQQWSNTWVKRNVGINWEGTSYMSQNTTFIYGDTEDHNGGWFTDAGAHVVDVVGGTEVGMDFGSFIIWPYPPWVPDPWWEAMWDTMSFMGETIGPFVPEVGAPDFFYTKTMQTYLDPLPPYTPAGPIDTDLSLTALRRMSNRRGSGIDCDLQYVNYFTTPTGCGWNLSHIVAVGGPKVNLATEYFNDYTWAVWTSDESGCEFDELADGGIYVFPSGNMYPASDGGYSVISIAEDLNLTSWTTVYDDEMLWDEQCNWQWWGYETDLNANTDDGATLSDPYAGLVIWGMSGWDTRAACNWFAHYRKLFNDQTDWITGLGLATNATLQPPLGLHGGRPKLGATTIILHTDHVAECCDEDWLWGIKEILGPVAGRWRLSSTAWGVWISAPVSIRW